MIVIGVLKTLSNGGSTAAPMILLFNSSFVFGLNELEDLKKKDKETQKV